MSFAGFDPLERSSAGKTRFERQQAVHRCFAFRSDRPQILLARLDPKLKVSIKGWQRKKTEGSSQNSHCPKASGQTSNNAEDKIPQMSLIGVAAQLVMPVYHRS